MKRFLAAALTLVLAAATQPCLGASPFSSDADPVERASASLSRTLAALEAERREASHRQTLEQARLRILALGYRSLSWLSGQGRFSQTGIFPVAGRTGLLVSYNIPVSDPLAFLRGRSWTYDNAVGAIALLLQGQPLEAKTVLTALSRFVGPDGGIGFSYAVNSLDFDPRVRTGTLAWTAYAFAFTHRVTGDNKFQPILERILAKLKTLQLPSGLFKGGPDVSWVSTEHQMDAYFALREAYRVTGNSEYLTMASQLKGAILANLWVSTGSGGHFLQGLNDPTASLDANTLGALFLSAIGQAARAAQALSTVESVFWNSKKITGSSKRFYGYAPDSSRRTIWLEGTLIAALAYLRVGNTTRVNTILSNVKKIQDVWISKGKWRGALPYAVPRYVNPDGDTFAEWESVTGTSTLLWHTAASSTKNLLLDRD